MKVPQHIDDEVGTRDQHAAVHQPREQKKPPEVRAALAPQKRQETKLVLACDRHRRLVDPGEIGRRDGARGRRRQKNDRKAHPRLFPCLGPMENPARRAEGRKTGHGHHPGPMSEIHPAPVGVNEIGEETVPGRDGEVPHGDVGDRAGDQQPRALFRKEKRQRQQGQPHEGLAGHPGQNEGLPVTDPAQRLDGEQLGPRADQLRHGRQQADLKG